MPYSVTLERGADGGYMAWVHELPGCFARGATRDEVEAKIGPAIDEFCQWLESAGESPPKGPVQYAIVAEVETPEEGAKAGSDVLLEPDRETFTNEYWNRLERWLQFSRRDLLSTMRDIDQQAFDWKPEGSPRTIREHLHHIAFVDFMYMAWTFDLQSKNGIAEFLHWTRSISLKRMGELARTRGAPVTQAQWSGALRPELWTARKAARRMLWHERLHLRAVQRLLQRKGMTGSAG